MDIADGIVFYELAILINDFYQWSIYEVACRTGRRDTCTYIVGALVSESNAGSTYLAV
jgi:hypothetical protein